MSSKPLGGHVRDHRKDPFARISVDLIDRFGSIIGAYGIAVYVVLARYANRITRSTFVGHERIAEIFDISPATVKRALDVLARCGLIRIDRGKEKGTRNIYTLLDVPPVKVPGSTPLFDAAEPEGSSQTEKSQKKGKKSSRKSMTYEDGIHMVAPTELPEVAPIELPGRSGTQKKVALTGNRYKEEPAKNNQNKTTTTVDRSAVGNLLFQFCPNYDEPALEKIIHGILCVKPDASTGEILHFLALKGEYALSHRTENPVGFLIKVLPDCFAGEAFERFRANLRATEVKAATDVKLEADQKEWLKVNRPKLFSKGTSA